MLADLVARLEHKAARRSRLFAGAASQPPARWFRPAPRPSVQYAGHMATTAARDHRLVPQAKAALHVIRARCGTGTHTATTKTTLAHIMGVCTRSIGRYLADLVRFGYIETRSRAGRGRSLRWPHRHDHGEGAAMFPQASVARRMARAERGKLERARKWRNSR